MRNFGLLACYILGVIMVIVLPWRAALGAWAVFSVVSGLLYFCNEIFAYLKEANNSEVSKPNPITIIQGLAAWPIMLPEAIEYFLADLGILKRPKLPKDESAEPRPRGDE